MKFLLFALPILGQPFNPSPRRASRHDWNTPRGHGGFLAKRDAHSEDYFNNPPVNRPLDSVSVPVAESLFTRATSGRWENLQGSGM